MGPLPELPFALLMLAVVGAANSVRSVAAFTLLQRLIPDRILTRVFGVVWSLAMGGVALGSIVAPALVEAIGAREAFIGVGAILPLLSVATYRKLASIDRDAAPAPELELVQRVPMFQPFSIAAKERVAGNLRQQSVHAGDVVIRAGERGDSFYIVGNGALEITGEGLRTIADEGDYFGETLCSRRASNRDCHGARRKSSVCAATGRFPRCSHRARSGARGRSHGGRGTAVADGRKVAPPESCAARAVGTNTVSSGVRGDCREGFEPSTLGLGEAPKVTRPEAIRRFLG